MKPSRVSRVVQILTTLQAGKSYAVSDLVKIFGMSRRTIFRDLKELQAPLAALNIENNLPTKIRQYCNTALRNISTRAGAQAPMGGPGLLDKTFVQLQKAIAKKRKVNIRYHSLFEDKIIDLTLSPYHLLYNQRAWYVLGLSSLHKSVRTFKFNRIKELKILDKCFIEGEDFDLYEYLGRAWSMIPEGRIYNIKLRFLPKLADNATEVQWHGTQKVTRNSDGSATIEFRVDGLGEIIWWILGYGDQVQVLSPKVLRNKVVETAKNMVKLNEHSGPVPRAPASVPASGGPARRRPPDE
jgi:proteasome accessory factor B